VGITETQGERLRIIVGVTETQYNFRSSKVSAFALLWESLKQIIQGERLRIIVGVTETQYNFRSSKVSAFALLWESLKQIIQGERLRIILGVTETQGECVRIIVGVTETEYNVCVTVSRWAIIRPSPPASVILRTYKNFQLWQGYINWRDVQRKNVVNNVDMPSLRAPWQNGLFETNTQNNTKHVEHPDATDIQNKLFFFFLWIFLFLFLFMIT